LAVSVTDMLLVLRDENKGPTNVRKADSCKQATTSQFIIPYVGRSA
jgi:hypothetical protein